MPARMANPTRISARGAIQWWEELDATGDAGAATIETEAERVARFVGLTTFEGDTVRVTAGVSDGGVARPARE